MSKLDDMRWEARNQRFDNSEQEWLAIKTADEVVFDHVREHERGLAEATGKYESENMALVGSVGHVMAELIDFRKEIEGGRVAPTPESAEMLKQHRHKIDRLIESLEVAHQRSESQIARAEDPYANFERIASKYPPLLNLRPKRPDTSASRPPLPPYASDRRRLNLG